MAIKSFKLSHSSNMLLNVILFSIFNAFAFAFPSYRDSRQAESLEKPTSAINVQQVGYRLSCVSLFAISLHTYHPRSCFAGCKTPFRSNRVCCDRYCSCSSSCCLHYPEILLSAEVYATSV